MHIDTACPPVLSAPTNSGASDNSAAAVAHSRYPEKLLTPKQVAAQLGVSVDWVQAHATRKRPRIDHVRAGKLIRFTPQQVADFIRRQAVTHER
jgi:hypothetical protein